MLIFSTKTTYFARFGQYAYLKKEKRAFFIKLRFEFWIHAGSQPLNSTEILHIWLVIGGTVDK
jgi:hypothetical protein